MTKDNIDIAPQHPCYISVLTHSLNALISYSLKANSEPLKVILFSTQLIYEDLFRSQEHKKHHTILRGLGQSEQDKIWCPKRRVAFRFLQKIRSRNLPENA